MLTSRIQETGECWYLAHPDEPGMFFVGYDGEGNTLFTPDPSAEGVEAFFEEETANAFCYFINAGTPLRIVHCVWSTEQTFIWKGIGDEKQIQ